MEFDPLKPNNNPSQGRPRSQSSFFQDIVDGLHEQEQEQTKHEYEQYDKIDFDDISLDINLGSLDEIVDLKNKVKDSVNKVQQMKAVSLIKAKKEEIEKALHSSKNIRSRDKFIFVYCSLLLHGVVYLLGSHPGYYFLYAMAFLLNSLFITRLYLFSLVQKTILITDFPYYCSALFGIFLLYYPENERLYLFCF